MLQRCNRRIGHSAGKGSESKDLVFQHMSNHYRRILNAKKAVDTSPPYCYKNKRAVINASSNSTLPRNRKATKPLLCRNVSPVLTERSKSSFSCKGSCWGTKFLAKRSQYHAGCIQDNSQKIPVKMPCIDMDLIDRITYDTKNGPAAYCDEGWKEIKAQHNDKSYKCFNSKANKKNLISMTNSKHRFPLKEKELKQNKKFHIKGNLVTSNTTTLIVYNKKCDVQVAKLKAMSKVRTLRVYCPPRRKVRISSQKHLKSELKSSLSTLNCKCVDICICDTNESTIFKKNSEFSKENITSSRDSAYNGGVSSLPESRSPTPDQKTKKEFSCIREEGKFYTEKKEETDEEDCYEQQLENGKNTLISSKASLAATFKTKTTDKICKESEALRKMKEDSSYIKFVQDITGEILEKKLYTNKALKKIMKRHFLANLKALDYGRMLKELESLRVQLGIPEDKDLFDINIDIKESLSDLVSPYPTISDSEFVIPKSSSFPQSKIIIEQSPLKISHKNVTKSFENFPKSISKVLEKQKKYNKKVFGSEHSDEDDLISVIEEAKAIKERKKEMHVERGKICKNNSDQSVSFKKKEIKQNTQKKTLQAKDSSSISSSDVEEKNVKVEYEDSSSRDDSCERKTKKKMCFSGKKNRNVSFPRSHEPNILKSKGIKEKKGKSMGNKEF